MEDEKGSGFTLEQVMELLSITHTGAWSWDLITGEVIYSKEWSELLGYQEGELPPSLDTLEKLVFPEDFPYVNSQIKSHLDGTSIDYEAEFRMRCKDGRVIWAQNKGKITRWDENGKPMRLVGLLHDITAVKKVEIDLREKQQTLDLSLSVAALGTWDWNLEENRVKYNAEYLKMLGYSKEEITGSIEEWKGHIHPEDFARSMEAFKGYLKGNTAHYECEMRMRRKDGHFIWTRNLGRVVEWDISGKPKRVIGGHLNIDDLKRTQEELERHRLELTDEVAKRTSAITEQDKMLWHVTDVAKRIMAIDDEGDFDGVVTSCLKILGEATNRNRVYVWKDLINEEGVRCCTQVYEWVRGAESIQGVEEFENIPYINMPNFQKVLDTQTCLNSQVKDLVETERAVLEPQGILTILIAPILVRDQSWGFIGIDNCEDMEVFSELEENMMLMSGFLIGNAVEKNNTQAHMREIEERINIMFNATPLCCSWWNKEQKIMACNEEAVRLFGLNNQQEFVERFDELSPEYQSDGVTSADMARNSIQKAFDEGYYRTDWMHQKLDGTLIPSEVTLVRAKYHGEYSVLGYTRDMREIKAMIEEMSSAQESLRIAHEEALLSSKAKSNFLANMSHEIRTPMNAISGLAEIIIRDCRDKELEEHAQGIKQACSNLITIINDILDISKIESGKLEIVESEYNLASLLNDAINISRMRLGDKPILFVTDISCGLPSWLYGDETRIRQILINLLSNAVKFTSEGYVRLSITHKLSGKRAVLEIKVEDTGSGISDEDMQRLFQEFERVNTKKNRSIEGTGLGLAITKRLCEMMNGSIEVKSEVGKGSVFKVTLPQICEDYKPFVTPPPPKKVVLYEPRKPYYESIARSIMNLGSEVTVCTNQSELLEALMCREYDYAFVSSFHINKAKKLLSKEAPKTHMVVLAHIGEIENSIELPVIFFPAYCLAISDILCNRMSVNRFDQGQSAVQYFQAPEARVLLVDDNQVNLKVATGLMAPYKLSIDTAVNGLDAVEKVSANRYDLVFMDHMMPEMDGIDATTAIRAMEGDYYKNLPIVALTANAIVGTREMFIQEGMNDFLAKPIEITKLNAILTKWIPSYLQQTLQPEDLPEKPEEPVALAIEGVNTAAGIAMIGGSLEGYLQILSSYYADGIKKCGTLLKHLGENNLKLFKTEIHAVKGTSATIGAEEVSRLARALEDAAVKEQRGFIDDHINDFLRKFTRLLERIKPHLLILSTIETGESKPEGEAVFLKNTLLKLEEAIEFVDIGRIEGILAELAVYSWPEPVSEGLGRVKEYISVFEYDEALEVVKSL